MKIISFDYKEFSLCYELFIQEKFGDLVRKNGNINKEYKYDIKLIDKDNLEYEVINRKSKIINSFIIFISELKDIFYGIQISYINNINKTIYYKINEKLYSSEFLLKLFKLK